MSAKVAPCAVSTVAEPFVQYHLLVGIPLTKHHAPGNANLECFPQKKSHIEKVGRNYGTFAALLVACFIVFCWVAVRFLYTFNKRRNRGEASTMSTERRIEEDDKYALSRIGNDSVYSYFVTDNRVGWLVALTTLY